MQCLLKTLPTFSPATRPLLSTNDNERNSKVTPLYVTCASNTLTGHMVSIAQSFMFTNLERVVIENESTYMYSIVDHNVDFSYGIHEMKTSVS